VDIAGAAAQAIHSVDFAHVDTILLRRVHLGGITAHPTGAWGH
jgi:hypothetical protein